MSDDEIRGIGKTYEAGKSNSLILVNLLKQKEAKFWPKLEESNA
jgi:hypothetical protein